MELLERFKRPSERIKQINEITKDFPNDEMIAKEILCDLNNSTTQIEIKQDIKSSYYVFLNDKIYLSNKQGAKDNVSRVILIAHESVHSVQSKLLQKINFALANLELILFLILLIFEIFNKIPIICAIGYFISIFSSILIRWILEYDAVKRSIILAEEYMNKRLDRDVTKKVVKYYKKQITILLPFFFLNLLFWKIIRGMIIAFLI